MAKKIKDISCKQLKDKMVAGDDFILLDVREPEEFEICQLEGALLVPYSEFAEHIDDFDQDKNYIVHCKLGGRSSKACEALIEKGFKDVTNLSGGIIEWANQIDKKLEKY